VKHLHLYGLRGTIVTLLLLAYVAAAAAQSGHIGGSVRGSDGAPLGSATIRAENEEVPPVVFTTRTDDKGRFGLVGLAPGRWTFTAAADGHMASRQAVRIRGDGPTRPLEFKLNRHGAGLGHATNGLGVGPLQEILQRADQLYARGHYEEAIDAYRMAMAGAPGLAIINLQIGNGFRRLNRHSEAVAAYQDVLKHDPSHEGARIGIGLTFFEKGDFATADLMLTAAAQEFGASREVFHALGEVKLAREQPEEAERWFRRALDTDPSWARPMFRLGFLAMERGDTATASRYLEHAVESAPGAGEAERARTILEQLRR
jgi:tetratricopeptide (TPR) repeat protein